MDKVDMHLKICQTLGDTYRIKNHDYGDSFSHVRSEVPNAILVRLYDKYSRLKTLLNGEDRYVKDESINDTLFDMANYCILELIERMTDQENLNKSSNIETLEPFNSMNLPMTGSSVQMPPCKSPSPLPLAVREWRYE